MVGLCFSRSLVLDRDGQMVRLLYILCELESDAMLNGLMSWKKESSA